MSLVAGRWEDIGDELFTLKDRHDKEFVLSPVGKQTKVNYISNCLLFKFYFQYWSAAPSE
jgi:hypothetical protein